MSFESILSDLTGIPKAISDCLNFYISDGKKKLENVRLWIRNSTVNRVVFIGHSYNYFASSVPFRYLNSRIQNEAEEFRKECVIYEIDEFISYYNPQHNNQELHSDTLFVFVSRSGESLQIKLGIKKLKEYINPENIWSVTDKPDSYLAKVSHFSFPMKSGHEEVMGSKSYLNTLLVLYLLARSLMGKEAIPENREEEIRNLIFEMKFYSDDWESNTKKVSDFLGKDFNFLYFISTGASMATASQSALACKAYARTHGEAISLGLFLHGPFQIIDDSFRCVIISGDKSNIDNVLRLIDMITNKLGHGKVILINNNQQLSTLGRNNANVFVFEHTTENTYLAPIFEYLVIQYLFFKKALERGVIE